MADLDFEAIHAAAKQAKRDLKKNRKPYTITKPRESWTDEEHDLFMEALNLFERDWKRIEAHIKTKTVIQIRSHAQKFFLKMTKTGKQECIPPPRPKRRSKKPYPKIRDRKKKDDDYSMGQASAIGADFLPSGAFQYHEQAGLHVQSRPMMAPIPSTNSSSGHSLQWALWERQQLAELQQEQLSQAQYYLQQAIAAHSTDDKKAGGASDVKAPNFQKIYSFLGSLFDPSTTGHVDQLRTMDDMDRQVIQLLMQNLASNLGKHHSVASEFQPSIVAPDKDVYGPMHGAAMNKLLLSHRPGSLGIEPAAGGGASFAGFNHMYPGAPDHNMS